MISSLLLTIQRNLGAGFPSFRNPLAFSLLVILSKGAVSLKESVTLVSLPFTRLNLVCLNLLISTDRNLAVPLLALVILVFSSDSSNLSSCFRNSRIFDKITLQSSRDPLTPMIQSSAYLT